eukprot:141411-Pleurochrysis_carterae.AAC.1
MCWTARIPLYTLDFPYQYFFPSLTHLPNRPHYLSAAAHPHPTCARPPTELLPEPFFKPTHPNGFFAYLPASAVAPISSAIALQVPRGVPRSAR